MALRINSDMNNMNALRNLYNSQKSLMKTMEKLSSGLRINRASDDPAGLVISEQLRSKIGSLNRDIENTSMAIRKYESADAALAELRSNLSDLRAHAVGAANGGFNDRAVQDAYGTAAAVAAGSFNQIVRTAGFNEAILFDGGEGSLADISLLQNIDLSSPEKAEFSIKVIDKASAELDAALNNIGSVRKIELESKRSNLEVAVQNLTASKSQIRDADYTVEVANMIKDRIRVKSAVALLAQANMNQRSVISMLDH